MPAPDTLAEKIRIEEDLDGVRYILGRPPPSSRSPALVAGALIVFGTLFSGFAALWITLTFVLPLGDDLPDAIRWLLPLFGVPFLLVGQAPLALGLWALRGVQEIRLRDDRLSAMLRAGPYRWTRSRPVESIVRLAAGEFSGSRTRVLGMSGVKVICTAHKPLFLAGGHPLDTQEALAKDLEERLGLESSPTRTRGMDPQRQGKPEQTAATRRHKDVELCLPTDTSRGAPLTQNLRGLLIFTLIWNLVMGGLLTGFLLLNDRQPTWILVILSVFCLVGVVFIFLSIKTLMARAKLHPGSVTASVQPVLLGEDFSLHFVQKPKSNVNVARVGIRLLCRESASHRRGTDTVVETEDVFDEARDAIEEQMTDSWSTLDAEERFRIPPTGMHSFHAAHNSINWYIESRTELRGWPDYRQLFELEVSPLRISSEQGVTDAS